MFLNKQRGIYILLGMMILLMTIGFTYGYLTRTPREMRPPTQGEATKQTETTPLLVTGENNPAVVRVIEPEASLTLERFYTRCQHSLQDEMVIDTRHVGLAKEELKFSYPSWEMVEFSPDQVMLTVDIDGYCPNHFILLEEEGYLVVYRSEKETGALYPVEVTHIRMEWLSQDMQEKVHVGLVVDTLEELEHLIENWES